MERFWSYILAKSSKILAINVILELVVIIALGVIALSSPNCPEQLNLIEDYRWAAIGLSFIAQIYFAYYSTLQLNLVELYAFLIVSILTTICFYIKVIMLWPECSTSSTAIPPLMITLSVVVFINQIVYCLAVKVVSADFKWKMFKSIGVDAGKQQIYKNWNEFKALLKVNLLIQYLIFLGYFMFVDYVEYDGNHRILWYIIDGSILLLYTFITRIAFIAANSKHKFRNIHIFLGFILLIQIYECYKVYPMIVGVLNSNNPDVQKSRYSIIISQIVFGLVAIVVQIYTAIVAKRYKEQAKIIHESLKASDSIASDT